MIRWSMSTEFPIKSHVLPWKMDRQLLGGRLGRLCQALPDVGCVNCVSGDICLIASGGRIVLGALHVWGCCGQAGRLMDRRVSWPKVFVTMRFTMRSMLRSRVTCNRDQARYSPSSAIVRHEF